MPDAIKKLEVYGCEFADNPQMRAFLSNALQRELFFFRECTNLRPYTGAGRYFHARNICDMLWRQKGKEQFEWHEWLETALEEYCQTDEVLITGPASGGKTFGAALYALLFWMCDPLNTGVIVSSTTLPGLKRRIWGEIRKLFLYIKPGLDGVNNLVDSLTALQTTKGDMQHGIFGIAVAEGNEQKALGRIIGFHPKRLLVIVDELTDVPWSIVEALTNLFTGKQRAQFIGIGNASSIFDPLGKMSEPKEGWGSITVENERWETRRGGICLHLDGLKCPNIKSGKIQFKFLLTQSDIDATIRQYGENSPQMWRFRRGFWCPEGTVKSILSETLIAKFRAMDKATWDTTFTAVAALDPAFEGGDRCVLRFGKYGKDSSGVNVMELGESITIKVDLQAKEPIHYQIARHVKTYCTERQILPYNFAMDTTGEGGGLASIIAEEWGFNFHRVEFGGKASEFPIDATSEKRCCDEYSNKVTELWYSFRSALMASQIRGLDPETAVEFCARLYESKDKIRVEPKSEMKTRLNGRSPDNADAVCVLLDLVKHRGGLGNKASKVRSSMRREWEALVQEFQVEESDYANDPIMNV